MEKENGVSLSNQTSEIVDDYLGFIELLGIFIKKKLITKETVDDMFGHYIVDAWQNNEVQNLDNIFWLIFGFYTTQ